MKKGTNLLCRWCFKNFPKATRTNFFTRYCSDACGNAHLSNGGRKRCPPPGCKDTDFIEKEVIFKDGTHHIKRVCNVCRKGQFIGAANAMYHYPFTDSLIDSQLEERGREIMREEF